MKVLDHRKIPDDRLATTDEMGRRVFVFPAVVNGAFRKYRSIVQFVLIAVLLLLPWIKINGSQAVLLDVVNRKFAFFGLTFWAHDGPLIFFILAFLAIGLAFVTAIWGRVWCGWACPQTVFVDGIFRRVEHLLIGSHIKQRRLALAPASGKKIITLSLLWFIFMVISLIISHSFLAYFVGAERLLDMAQNNPSENWSVFLGVVFMTALIMFDFGWFREQFCIIMCPYGRFQSVLMDDDSMAITYDYNRGEPRKGKAATVSDEGDCIDCYRCVAVCPTGIDIRRGLQIECVACAACIDACDEVMEKIGRPKKLIRYSNENRLQGVKSTIFSVRTAVYSVLLILITSLLITTVSGREDIMITILRGKGTPFQVVEETGQGKSIVNQFKIHFKNQTFEDAEIEISVPAELKNSNLEVISQNTRVRVEAGKDTNMHFFLKFPDEVTGSDGVENIELDFVNIKNNKSFTKDVKLIGPKSI